jgi:calcyclin binding protein
MSELDEVRYLLSQATFPGVKSVLQTYERKLLDAQKDEVITEEKQEIQTEDTPPSPPEETKKSSTVELKKDVKVAAPVSTGGRVVYTPITDFAWDQNGYDSPIVTVYVDIEGVGTVKDNVKCDFTKSSFDLVVMDLKGKNYRLLKDNLEKDILPDKSKILIKKNKVVVKLQKVKGQYSYENWPQLTSKKSAEKRNQANKDPSAGIMDMMKDMYDEGDDNMKKIIGEAMMKSKSGEKMDTPPMPSMDGI